MVVVSGDGSLVSPETNIICSDSVSGLSFDLSKGSNLLNLRAIFRVLLSQLRVRHSRAIMITLTGDLVVTTILFHTKVKILNTGWAAGTAGIRGQGLSGKLVRSSDDDSVHLCCRPIEHYE